MVGRVAASIYMYVNVVNVDLHVPTYIHTYIHTYVQYPPIKSSLFFLQFFYRIYRN